jgi:flagellar assembly protein FliH
MSKAAKAEVPERPDISVLMGRGAATFSRDERFVAPTPAPPPEDSALPFASFDKPQPAAPTAPRPPDPVETARGQGYAEGHAEGYAQAEHEAQEREAAWHDFAFAFDRINGQCAELLRQRLMATVVALCEATLAPMALDHDALARRVERAVAMFSRADDERVIRLNPDDLAMVKPLLPAEWTFAPDPMLEPGALRVEAHSRGMDGGGVEDGPAQWRRAIAEALDLGTPDPEGEPC